MILNYVKLIILSRLELRNSSLIHRRGLKLSVNICPSFYLDWRKKFEENEIDQTNFDRPQIHLGKDLGTVLTKYGQTLDTSFRHILGLLRIQASYSSILLI